MFTMGALFSGADSLLHFKSAHTVSQRGEANLGSKSASSAFPAPDSEKSAFKNLVPFKIKLELPLSLNTLIVTKYLDQI